MRDPYRRLVQALMARSGGQAVLVRGSSRDWASVTFSGTLNQLTLNLPEAVADAFVAGLEEAEFCLPGHLVADIAIVRRSDHEGAALLEIEALVLEQA